MRTVYPGENYFGFFKYVLVQRESRAKYNLLKFLSSPKYLVEGEKYFLCTCLSSKLTLRGKNIEWLAANINFLFKTRSEGYNVAFSHAQHVKRFKTLLDSDFKLQVV